MVPEWDDQASNLETWNLKQGVWNSQQRCLVFVFQPACVLVNWHVQFLGDLQFRFENKANWLHVASECRKTQQTYSSQRQAVAPE